MSSLAERVARVRAGLALRQRNPLEFWHFGVPRMREAFGMFTGRGAIEELHLRGPNKGTKTESVAAFVLSCMQKQRRLDGLRLPQWRGPVEALCCVLDYPQQLSSVQPAYLRLLGAWPHHARYAGETLKSLRVKPLGASDNEAEWSVLRFVSQENKRSGLGARADIVHFDEPPVAEILRELRKAAHAHRLGIRVIGETPIFRRQWGPLKEDYGDPPRRAITRVGEDWAECRWSLDEVAEWILSPDDKARLLRNYAKDVGLVDARVHGDYCDTSGLCPFDVPTLERMLAECVAPTLEDWNVQREVDGEEGRTVTTAKVQVQVLRYATPGTSYCASIDPSKGIQDDKHDPGAILVSAMGSGEDVALHEGYLGSYGLGTLAAGLARKAYNGAMVNPESNSGWADGVIRGLNDSGYGKIARTRKRLASGEESWLLGFETTTATRPLMIEAIKEWIDAYRAGAPYAPCRFRRVIETLLDTIMADGKIVAGPGFHDEFLILKGQNLLKCRPVRHDPNLARPAYTPPQPIGPPPELTWAELIKDEHLDSPPGFARRAPVHPRARPR